MSNPISGTETVTGDFQHRIWRSDVRANLAKAMEAAGDDKAKQAEIALKANEVLGSIMIAERIGELSRTIASSDELVAELDDSNKRRESLLRLALEDADFSDSDSLRRRIEEEIDPGVEFKVDV